EGITSVDRREERTADHLLRSVQADRVVGQTPCLSGSEPPRLLELVETVAVAVCEFDYLGSSRPQIVLPGTARVSEQSEYRCQLAQVDLKRCRGQEEHPIEPPRQDLLEVLESLS